MSEDFKIWVRADGGIVAQGRKGKRSKTRQEGDAVRRFFDFLLVIYPFL